MHRFFIPNVLNINDEIYLDNAMSHQILNVLRMKIDDKFQLFNNTGKCFIAKIIFVENKKVKCKIFDEKIIENQDIEINIFQSILKTSKMELIIEKLTEIGINSFTPMITERTQKKDIVSLSANKIERLKKISIESSEQSGKLHIPLVNNVINILKLDLVNSDNMNVVFYENTEGAVNINKIKKSDFNKKSISVFIGPVGGFSIDEINYLKNQNSLIVNLGNTIFKSDTAAIISVSLLKYLVVGNLN